MFERGFLGAADAAERLPGYVSHEAANDEVEVFESFQLVPNCGTPCGLAAVQYRGIQERIYLYLTWSCKSPVQERIHEVVDCPYL